VENSVETKQNKTKQNKMANPLAMKEEDFK